MATCKTCGCGISGFSVCSDPWHLLQAGYTMKDGVVTPPTAPVGEPAAMPPEMPEIQVGDIVHHTDGVFGHECITWVRDGSELKFIERPDETVIAIYRDPLWRRTGRKEPTK